MAGRTNGEQSTHICARVGRRFVLGLLTLIALSMITFLLPYLGGVDPGEMILRAKTGGDLPASREALRVLRDQMGLDVPMHVLYLRWFSEALQGNLGYSYITLRPTVQVLAEAALTTLQLALGAMSLIVVVGVPAGTIAAVKRNSYVDRAISMLAILGVSVPVYFLAFLAILCLGVYLSLFPVAGRGGLAHLVMPATLLAVPGIAMTVRLVRYSFLEVLQEDHITVARAKGVSERVIILKHAFKNVAPPIITYLGLQLGWLCSGAVILEKIFAWPGLGRLLVDSVLSYDLPVVQGCVLLTGGAFVVINFVADIVQLYVEPRIDPEAVI